MTYDSVAVAARIRANRERRGISMRSFSADLGIDPAAWSRTERGSRVLTADELIAAAGLLGLSLDDLVRGEDVRAEVAHRTAVEATERLAFAISAWSAAVVRAQKLGAAGEYRPDNAGVVAEMSRMADPAAS